MRRYFVLVLVAAATIMGFPALAAAEESRETKVTYGVSAPIEGLAAKQVNAQRDTPPGDGCGATVEFQTTATYVNNALVDTETPYSASIDCGTTGSGQTMRALWAGAELWINSTRGQPEAQPDECSHESSADPLCLDVRSGHVALCFQLTMSCAGHYYAIGGYSLLLPDGWVWTSWPSNCLPLGPGPAELTCQLQTDSYYVSPILPTRFRS
jgi:hypothetical protein